MKKGTKGCVAAAVVAYLAFTAVLIFVKMTDTKDYSASPTASRDTPGFKDGSVGLLEDSSREVDYVRPASAPMGMPQRHEFKEDEVTFIWPGEKDLEKGPEPDAWVDELQGDDAIELVAVATWFPGEDDIIPAEPGTRYPITFYSLDSFQEISDADLDQWGVPEKFRAIDPPIEYHTPRISFLFRTSGMETVKCNKIKLGDVRTGAEVGYDLEYVDEVEEHTNTEGQWTRVDTALLMWHSSEVVARFQFLTGNPETITLPREMGAEKTGGEHLRVQWIEAVPGEIDINSSSSVADPFGGGSTGRETSEHRKILDELKKEHKTAPNSFTIKPDVDEDDPEPPRVVIRSSSDTLLRRHSAIVTKDGLNWDWRRERELENEGFFFGSITDPDPSSSEIQLLHFPHIVELEWILPRVPGSPNPDPGEDLFEIRIPRLTMDPELNDAEDNLIALLSVATQVAWEHSNRWDDEKPKEFPDDYSFRNTTPQELLEWYRKNTRGCIVKYDEEDFVLYVNQETESWWTKIRNRFPILNGIF